MTPEEVRLIAGASMDYERRLVAVITRLDGQVQRLATYLDAVTDDRQVVAEERDRLNARLAETATVCQRHGCMWDAPEAHEACRAEQRDTIKALMVACDELMTEFVSKKRAANWGTINDAMVAGAASIRASTL